MTVPSFEIAPASGVGPIKFGISRHEVRRALGVPDFSDDHRDGFLSGFQVNYDEAGNVEFIEMANSNKFSTTFQGKCLHRLLANEAIAFVERYGELDSDDPELGHSFIFPKLEMSLWRAVMPNSPDDDEGQYFDAIGIGRRGYFSGEY